MNIPKELKYTKNHEWVKIIGDTATIGITEFAQKELGDIVFVEVETVGETVSMGDIFGTVEAVKTVSDLFMPLTATITEFNEELETSPELVNKDPYGSGWMIKVTFEGEPAAELLSAGDYMELVGAEIEK